MAVNAEAQKKAKLAAAKTKAEEEAAILASPENSILPPILRERHMSASSPSGASFSPYSGTPRGIFLCPSYDWSPSRYIPLPLLRLVLVCARASFSSSRCGVVIGVTPQV
eukprot:870778-Prorocentrum_minimum.AAC.1